MKVKGWDAISSHKAEQNTDTKHERKGAHSPNRNTTSTARTETERNRNETNENSDMSKKRKMNKRKKQNELIKCRIR